MNDIYMLLIITKLNTILTNNIIVKINKNHFFDKIGIFFLIKIKIKGLFYSQN